jgi:hypothetical protein
MDISEFSFHSNHHENITASMLNSAFIAWCLFEIDMSFDTDYAIRTSKTPILLYNFAVHAADVR